MDWDAEGLLDGLEGEARDARARLLDALHADGAGVEELRVAVPSPVMLRRVVAPARIGDVAVGPGDRVVIATLNAARAHGPYEPGRAHPPELRRLWFGAGPHYCLGMPLAVEQARRVLDVVRAAGPLRVVRRRVAHRVLVPAYRELVVAPCPT